MNTVSTRGLGWPRGRWWGVIGLVLFVQVGLIYWLGERPGKGLRRAATGPQLRVVEPGPSQLLALTDPTLFALPHRESFSGPAWLNGPTQSYAPFAWSSEPPRWLPQAAERLGAAFRGLLPDDEGWGLPLSVMPTPEPKPARTGGPELLPENSSLRLAGDLAGRQLLAQPALGSQVAPVGVELLTNSVVQIAVTPEGQTVAAMLLVSSGSKEADLVAMSQARAARFRPMSQPGSERPGYSPNGLSWGELVFEWHTVPSPPTNSAPGR